MVRITANARSFDLKPYREMQIKKAEKIAPPFYMLFNAEPSLSSYKVMWKYVAGEISGKGKFACAVASPFNDRYVDFKTVIPNEKLMLVPLKDEDEAHYLTAMLNSTLARHIVASYTIETAIATHVLKHIRIAKFDPNDTIHKRLYQLSNQAHKLASEGKYDELSKVEGEIDRLVAQLYDLTDEELKEVRESLRILESKAIETEEVEEGFEEAKPKADPIRALEGLIKEFKEKS